MAELASRGIATALICSEPFITLAQTQARVLGIPDLRLVMIPHPLGGLTLDKVRERANIAVPQVIRVIKEFAK